MTSRATRSGGGKIQTLGNQEAHEEDPPVEATTSREKRKKKFEQHGKGKTIAKHAKHLATGTEAKERPETEGIKPSQRGRPAKKRSSATMTEDQEEVPKRRRSPRKKIIAESPPPETTLDPFPPARPPMLVSDKPAVRNRYGEKVPAPVGEEQRLRQAINFLSDEGPENCQDFEEKLDKLEKYLRKNHPNGVDIIEDGPENVKEMLFRRVEWMIWAARNRIREGSEGWFIKHQFPDMPQKQISPGTERWRDLDYGLQFGAPRFPKLQILLAEEKEKKAQAKADAAAAAAQAPKSKGKAPAATAAPPAEEATDDEDQPPWEEPMPREEIWYRKQAPYFPFGETPHMEKVMSNQIHEDLRRGKEAKERAAGGWYTPFLRATHDWLKGKPDDWTKERPSPWKLPEIDDKFVQYAERKFGMPNVPGNNKRKATAQSAKAAGKRPRV